ncbi:putative membrane protein-like [Capsicum annuum]|nr:putative membrane protein-like [Capsicum annuum]KAF3662962.1 putative membrane protein-like [Capsicum annuum]
MLWFFAPPPSDYGLIGDSIVPQPNGGMSVEEKLARNCKKRLVEKALAARQQRLCHLELVDIEARVSLVLVQLELAVSISAIELLHWSLVIELLQDEEAGYMAPHFENKLDHIQPQPANLCEALRREIEKELIREEVIAEDIAQRRVLDFEVRRELMRERQLAQQSGKGFSPFSSL